MSEEIWVPSWLMDVLIEFLLLNRVEHRNHVVIFWGPELFKANLVRTVEADPLEVDLSEENSNRDGQARGQNPYDVHDCSSGPHLKAKANNECHESDRMESLKVKGMTDTFIVERDCESKQIEYQVPDA